MKFKEKSTEKIKKSENIPTIFCEDLEEMLERLDFIDMRILRILREPKTANQVTRELGYSEPEAMRKRIKKFVRFGFVEDVSSGNPKFYRIVENSQSKISELFENFEKVHKIKFVD